MNRKSGIVTIVYLLAIAVVGLVALCGRHGITTRSIVTTVTIDARGTNITANVTIDGQRVDVLGSGGVSIPFAGGDSAAKAGGSSALSKVEAYFRSKAATTNESGVAK